LAKNDEGEFELILGNRQLLSVFFIVVILLGVFFTMGYIVGHNSAPLTAEAAPKTGNPALVVDAPVRSEAPAAETSSAPETTQSSAAQETERAVSTEPQKPEPDREPVKPVSSKAAVIKTAKSTASSRPVTGQAYLQLAATSQHEADIMVDVLQKKGFRAMAAEIEEKPGTYRVLVGPVLDNTTNKIRADLQASGFPGNAAIRRSF